MLFYLIFSKICLGADLFLIVLFARGCEFLYIQSHGFIQFSKVLHYHMSITSSPFLLLYHSVALISHILHFLILSYISLKRSLLLSILLILSDSSWLISLSLFILQIVFLTALSAVNQLIEYINFKMLTIIYPISQAYLYYLTYYQISVKISDFDFEILPCFPLNILNINL